MMRFELTLRSLNKRVWVEIQTHANHRDCMDANAFRPVVKIRPLTEAPDDINNFSSSDKTYEGR